MAFSLLERIPNGAIWQDGDKRHFVSVGGTILNYLDTATDSMLPVDMSPVRVNNAVFDGWRIVQNGWHYALGKDIANHGQQDGWVGFGGRAGNNWFKFRLIGGGYFHVPFGAPLLASSFTRLSGNPSYDRANLSTTTETITIGPQSDRISFNAVSIATWSNIFPGVDLRWRVEGRQLKEEIILSQATREALPNPTTPAADTWFGWVFQVDVNDVPKFVLDNVETTTDDILVQGDSILHMNDAIGRLLAFMPLDYAYSEPDIDGDRQQVNLRKRLWSDADGNHYLIVGAPVLELNGLPAGAIIFDPTLTTGASADNFMDSNAATTNNGTNVQLKTWATRFHTLILFDMSSIGASDTCDSATFSMWSVEAKGAREYDGYKLLQTWTEGGSNWNTYDGTSNWPGSGGASTSGTDFNATSIGSITYPNSSQDTEAQSTLSTTQVEAEFGGNLDMLWGNTGAGANLARKWHSTDTETAAYRPQLVVVYTVAAGGAAETRLFHSVGRGIRKGIARGTA